MFACVAVFLAIARRVSSRNVTLLEELRGRTGDVGLQSRKASLHSYITFWFYSHVPALNN